MKLACICMYEIASIYKDTVMGQVSKEMNSILIESNHMEAVVSFEDVFGK